MARFFFALIQMSMLFVSVSDNSKKISFRSSSMGVVVWFFRSSSSGTSSIVGCWFCLEGVVLSVVGLSFLFFFLQLFHSSAISLWEGVGSLVCFELSVAKMSILGCFSRLSSSYFFRPKSILLIENSLCSSVRHVRVPFVQSTRGLCRFSQGSPKIIFCLPRPVM